MIKTEFMELLEELDRLNEATDKSAERAFWAAAKRKQIDEVSFHAAYDEELKELGLMDIFNAQGSFTGRSVYGRIKEAKEANPDSWALKALSKLWALRYVDSVYFASEAAAIKAADEEAEKRRAALKAEQERVAKETRTNAIKDLTRDYKLLLPDALKEVDQKLLNQYMAAYSVNETDFDVVIESSQWGEGVRILPNKSTHAYRFNTAPTNKFKELLSLVYTELKDGMEKFEADNAKLRAEANKAIDIFKANGKDSSAILLGESGKMYFLSDTSEWNLKSMAAKVNGEIVAVKSVNEIQEAYKVIYTRVSTSERNYSTYQDTMAYSYESWDSSEEDKIPGLIPVIGKGDGTWSYWETKAVKSGDGVKYSTMDNIDSWAYTETTNLATD